MGDYSTLDTGTFVDDSGTVREMVPSSVIAAVPAARAAAERYGRQVRFAVPPSLAPSLSSSSAALDTSPYPAVTTPSEAEVISTIDDGGP
ncbi:hypothetical protein [Streptomyces arenae]|uniref:hypothetical protein n=1 Tax=Streptomyces arenae TaxID=29301 RepID=UPI002657E602|nr:hypothetical protein [Streptomyces arenae]MCG7202939.1 hypothetical protein [Streptomyces arenae]